MRLRVGIGLLLATLAGGGLLIALNDRYEPRPTSPPKPPPVVQPVIQPVLEPERAPAEEVPRDDPGPPLAPVAPDHVEPMKPPNIAIQDGADIRLQTGPEIGEGATPKAPPPTPPVEPPAEPAVEPVSEQSDPPAPPPEPEKPPENPPEKTDEAELVSGKNAPPLPGPINDPADLPSPEEAGKPTPPVPGEPPPAPAPDTLLSTLNNFLRIVTLNGRIQLKATGRLYIDGALMNAEQQLEEQVGDFSNDWEFRTARLGLLGVIDIVELKVDYDFAGGQTLIGEPDLKDLWIGVREVPVIGRLRVGRMKEPVGLEQGMSGNARTFMESGLPQGISVGRNPGVLAFDTGLDGRLCWWAGVFGDTSTSNQFGRFGSNFSARICGTPLYEDDGKRLLHLGASLSYRLTDTEQISFAQRPESHLAPKIVATPGFTAGRQVLVGLEAAYLSGPFSLQAEFMEHDLNTEEYGRVGFHGAYLYGSWIVTGEHRVYRNGTFLRPRVRKPAFDDGLGGAFELAVRVSQLSLTSREIRGGTVTDETVGLTWYLDDHSRFMVNYIHSHRWGVGSADILQCRLQFDF